MEYGTRTVLFFPLTTQNPKNLVSSFERIPRYLRGRVHANFQLFVHDRFWAAKDRPVSRGGLLVVEKRPDAVVTLFQHIGLALKLLVR